MTDVLNMVKAVLATTAPHWLELTRTLPGELLNRQPATGEWSATECDASANLDEDVLAGITHFHGDEIEYST